ncbi:MAG TPA: carboxypeptidase regulatory-like domain-containing protein [Deltaproteobacteria bacterium]|nr:carboxypeptidase regulatory-like domain-containing protein [Deltaproteobacteria bacterium]
MRLTSALLLSGVACQPQIPKVEGQVIDVWENPIEGATVMVEGGTERPLTDAEGHYALQRVPGTHVAKAGHKDYIQQHVQLEMSEEGPPPQGPTFVLYPKPKSKGLFLVMHDRYEAIKPQHVQIVGGAVRSYRGIQDTGEVVAETAKPQLLWHTDLRQDEIMRLGLELRRLEFVDKAQLPGTEGLTEVSVNLYVDAGQIPIERIPLRSRSDYLIEPVGALQPGVYAFQTQDLLSASDGTAFSQLPPELRVVHPFQVR